MALSSKKTQAKEGEKLSITAEQAGESPVKIQRRPIYIAAGVVLLVLSILGAVMLVQNIRDTVDVVVARTDIEQGATITAEDLEKRTINADSGLNTITNVETIIDRQAATALPAGTVINPDQVTVQVLPPEGYSIVGVAVPFQRLPVTPLQRGDSVRVVDTPRDQGEPPTQGPIATRGQVVQVTEHPDQAITVVDLLVPEDEGSWVAARAATNRVAIVKDNVSSAPDSFSENTTAGEAGEEDGDR